MKGNRDMKKKFLIFIAVVCVALAATLCLVAGCVGGNDTPPKGKGEYVVFDDGCGKKYSLNGGDQLTVYYEYDAEKVLHFTSTYFKQATGEADSPNEIIELPCNNPTVYTCTATPLNDDGVGEECSLTVIISAQAITNTLSEHALPVNENVPMGTGAVYSFIPEMTGNYTVSCECKHESDEIEVTIINVADEVVSSGDVFFKGWKYYVHVKVKTAQNGTSVFVTASVTFTPPKVTFGDNEVKLCEYGSAFEFTPEEDGAYTTVTDEDCGFRFLDGETYESVSVNEYGEDALLQAGKKYFVQCTVGYQTERQATLTIKRVDRTFLSDTVNDLLWSETYVFTAEKHGNYCFEISENYSYGATEFNVYEYGGWRKYANTFIKNAELNLVLKAGKYIIGASHTCKAAVSYAPKKLTVERIVAADVGEVLSFTAPMNCVYNFSIRSNENAKFTVTDKGGNVVNGERLLAGEEYAVTFEAEYQYGAYWVEIAPVPDGEIALNKAMQPTEGYLYEFTVPNTGIYNYSYFKYKFVGAGEIEIYDENCEVIDSIGDCVKLVSGRKYYAVIFFDKPTDKDIKVIFYPDAIPVDTNVRIASTGYMRIELDKGCDVQIAIKHLNDATCKFLDGDLKEIKSFELNETEEISTISYTFEEGGIYYLLIEHYGTVPEISFVTCPEGCKGDFVAVSGVSYKVDSPASFRLESGSYYGGITIAVRAGIGQSNIMDCVKVYYKTANGGKSYLKLRKLNGDNLETELTFMPVDGVDEYFVETVNNLAFKIK